MRYATARYREHQRELAYRIYVSEALRTMTENTARIGGGSYIRVRYEDVIAPARGTSGQWESSEQVVSHVLGKLREIRGEDV